MLYPSGIPEWYLKLNSKLWTFFYFSVRKHNLDEKSNIHEKFYAFEMKLHLYYYWYKKVQRLIIVRRNYCSKTTKDVAHAHPHTHTRAQQCGSQSQIRKEQVCETQGNYMDHRKSRWKGTIHYSLSLYSYTNVKKRWTQWAKLPDL